MGEPSPRLKGGERAEPGRWDARMTRGSVGHTEMCKHWWKRKMGGIEKREHGEEKVNHAGAYVVT